MKKALLMVTFHGAEVLVEFVCDSATSVFDVRSTEFFTGRQWCRSHFQQCSSGVLLVVQLRLRACYQQTIGCTRIWIVEKEMYQAALSLGTQNRDRRQGYHAGYASVPPINAPELDYIRRSSKSKPMYLSCDVVCKGPSHQASPKKFLSGKCITYT